MWVFHILHGGTVGTVGTVSTVSTVCNNQFKLGSIDMNDIIIIY